MQSEMNPVLPSIPHLILESRRVRQELDQTVARLRITLGRSKSIALEGRHPSPALERALESAVHSTALDRLTKREIEVLRLIAEGKSTKQVAVTLGIAFRTAVCHRYRVFQKLQVHETASVVRLAVRAGLVKA